MLLALIVLGIVLAVVVHEAGHAIVAWAVGLPPSIISIGIGPILFRARLGGATVLLRPIPIQGFVLPTPRAGSRRVSLALVSVGGPAANLAAMALLGALGSFVDQTSSTTDPLAMVQLFFALTSLVPLPGGSYGGTDGWALLRLLWSRPMKSVIASYRTLFGLAAVMPGHAAEPSVATMQIAYWLDQYVYSVDRKQRREAAGELARILRADQCSESVTVTLIEWVISHELSEGDGTATPEEIDAWSAHALRLFDSPPMRVTRGGVLAVLGRPDEAEAMLVPLLDQDLEPLDALGCRAFLAIAAAARTDRAAADQWLRQARAIAKSPGQIATLEKLERRLPAEVLAG